MEYRKSEKRQSENRKSEKRRMESPINIIFPNARMWHLQCERALVRAAPIVVGTYAFNDLPPIYENGFDNSVV